MAYQSPIKRKSTNLLQGLLGALYSGSGVEANPEYLPPGTEGPAPQSGNNPFVGVGLLGRGMARDANANVLANQIAGQSGVQNSLAQARGMIPIQVQQQTELGNLATQQAEAANNKLLGEQGNTFFDYYQGLPADQQNLLFAGGTGQLNPSMVGLGRDVRAKFGNNLNEGYVRLPELAAKTGLETSVARDPMTLKGRLGQEYSKGIYPLGGGSHLDIGGGQNQVLQGANLIPHQSLEQIPTGKMTIDAEGNMIPVMGSKTVTTQIEQPARSYNLMQPVSDEELNAARVATSGSAGREPIIGPARTNDAYDALPRMSIGQATDSGQAVSLPEAKNPTAFNVPLSNGLGSPSPTQLQGLIPDAVRGVGSAASAVGQYGKEAAGAAGKSLRVDELLQLLDYIRKQTIRREPVTR